MIGIFSKSQLGKAIRHQSFDLPRSKTIPDTNIEAPFVILGDEAFPLLENLLKPYPRNQSACDKTKAIFNYRLSRARRLVENAFGILTQVFRIFATPIHINTTTAQDLITSACILHNLIIKEKEIEVTNDNVSSELDSFGENESFSEQQNNRSVQVRDIFKDYFNGIGSVPWQNDMIG